MQTDFIDAMRRAADATRTGNPSDATRIIQAALAGKSVPAADPMAQDGVIEGTLVSDSGEATDRPYRPAKKWGRKSPMPHRLLPGKFLRSIVTPAMTPSPEPGLADDARFEQHLFRSPQGQRSYRLYVPGSAENGVRGLIVMLHGCQQTPEDFAIGTTMNERAEEHGFIVAYPGQTSANNASSCWNWFNPGDQQRGQGEPSVIAGIAQEIVERHGIPPEHVYAAGLSAGGAMAAVLAEAYPDRFAAVGVHSGLACGMAQDVMSAFGAMNGGGQQTAPRPSNGPRPRLMVIHGSSDSTVAPSNGTRLFDEAVAAAPKATRHSEDAGTHRRLWLEEGGRTIAEHWDVPGIGHAWSGGASVGSYTAPHGPDASAALVRFFFEV